MLGRLIAGALGVLFAAGPGALTADAALDAAPRADAVLRAGAARVPLRVPAGTPLGGYGSVYRRLLVPDLLGRHPHAFWFRPSEGSLDEVAARALVLYAGATRVTWVALDVVAVDQRFVQRLASRFTASGIRPGAVIVSASHTHSGPGAYLSSSAFALSALDREDAAVRDAVLDAIVEAVRRAGAAARDARVSVAAVQAPDLTKSRLGQPLDRSLVVLKVTTTAGEPVAAVWNHALHGTMLGPRNLQLSGDVMGVATRAVEARLHAPALFVNGAVGDASPRHHGAAAMAEDGRALGEAVWAAWNAAKPIVAAPFAVRTARIDLPSPALPIRQCVGAWVPSSARVPLGLFLPAHTEMIAVALGRVAWVTMPGEPVSALGAALRAAAGERWAHVLIAGVSNDYLGYFVRSEDYGVVDYVTCAALYGPQLSRCLTATAADLLHRLPKPGTADARTPACEFAGE